jgi:hypothetical protein
VTKLMEIAIVALGVVVVAGVAARLVTLGRTRHRERIEVENMFAPEGREREWWEERH